jgi:hypothetical protein
MTGALLSLAQGHGRYERLATDFSKRSVKMSYDDIMGELLAHEANTEMKAPTRGTARSTVNPARETANMVSDSGYQSDDMYELAAALSRHLDQQPQPRKSSHRTGRDKKRRDRSEQPCRHFAKGHCERDPCPYKHEDSGKTASTSSSTADDKKGRKMTCYNCQKVGYHMSRDCTAPRRERTTPREQANHTGGKDGSGQSIIDVSAFMKQLIIHADKRRATASSDDECANLMIEYELNLDDPGYATDSRLASESEAEPDLDDSHVAYSASAHPLYNKADADSDYELPDPEASDSEHVGDHPASESEPDPPALDDVSESESDNEQAGDTDDTSGDELPALASSDEYDSDDDESDSGDELPALASSDDDSDADESDSDSDSADSSNDGSDFAELKAAPNGTTLPDMPIIWAIPARKGAPRTSRQLK